MAKRQRQRRRERRQHHSKRSGWQTRHSVISGAGLAAGATLGLAAPALGASQTYYVGNTGDANAAPPGDCNSNANTDCSLRQVVTLANANSGQYDYIYFRSGLTGTISLTTAAGGQIPITDAVYIYGRGPDQVSVAAAPNERIFDVNPTNSGDRVEIDGLTLTGGDVTGNGGAIQNDDGVLRIFDAVLSGNTASGAGGAIYEAGNASGGGYDDRITYATFSDNHADSGGAIYSDSLWGTLREATFTANSANNGYGGAIAGSGGYLYDTTVSGNGASVYGGGVAAFSYINMYGTILANNTAGVSYPDLAATNGNVGFDLVEDPGGTGIETQPTIITGQDPQLGALQGNGGNTPTLKPAAGSPVVDQSLSYSYYDQRGSDRIVDNPNRTNAAGGNGADIGAVELTLAEGPQATPPPPPPQTSHKKKCKKKKHKRSATSAKKCKKKKHKRSAGSDRFHFRMPQAAGRAWPDAAEHHPFRLRP
jgi:hypothetical protein